MFVAGFSCKTVSALNNCVSGRKRSIDEEHGETGRTFDGVLQYLLVHRPGIVLLENVVGLAKCGTLQHCLYLMKLCGYAVHYRTLCTTEFFLPQVRPRIWIMAIRLDLLENCGMSPDEWVA